MLRIQDGNDIFLAAGGAYAPSFFGLSLTTLSGLPRCATVHAVNSRPFEVNLVRLSRLMVEYDPMCGHTGVTERCLACCSLPSWRVVVDIEGISSICQVEKHKYTVRVYMQAAGVSGRGRCSGGRRPGVRKQQPAHRDGAHAREGQRRRWPRQRLRGSRVLQPHIQPEQVCQQRAARTRKQTQQRLEAGLDSLGAAHQDCEEFSGDLSECLLMLPARIRAALLAQAPLYSEPDKLLPFFTAIAFLYCSPMAEPDEAPARRRLDLQPSKLSQLAEGLEHSADDGDAADSSGEAAGGAADEATGGPQERQQERQQEGDQGDQLAGLVRAAVARSTSPAVLALVPPELRYASCS